MTEVSVFYATRSPDGPDATKGRTAGGEQATTVWILLLYRAELRSSRSGGIRTRDQQIKKYLRSAPRLRS